MNKTPLLQKKICFFLVGCLFFINSCGLDVFEVIPAPESVIHYPEYDTVTPEERYFHFWTKETTLSSYEFLGTEVYYKIYNNYSTMESERSILQNLATSESSTNSADRMISSYSYQPLSLEPEKTKAVLIPRSGSNQQVYIRLSNYLDTYTAKVCIGNSEVNEGDSGYLGIPLRTTDSNAKKTFDFGRTLEEYTDNSQVPVDGDIDLKYSSTASEENIWYVQLFAVSVARDASFALTYSSVCYLGAVQIDASVQDN